MEARNGRPPRPVTLNDYSFLQQGMEMQAQRQHVEATSRTVRNDCIIADEPAPVDAPIPVAATCPAAAAPEASQGTIRDEAAESVFCPCGSWHMPRWLLDLFTYEEVTYASHA